jgi:multidrug resistance efflux pump
MDLLLILIYVAFCYAIFKIFRIPVNQWSLATAALGGIVGISLLLLVMNYNHPFTSNARIYFAVTPVMPGVKGRVVEVPVQTNTPLKAGDVLFRIDPVPYENALAQRRAELAEAEQNVGQLKAAYDAAQATVKEATAARDRTKQAFDRYAAAGNDPARRGGGGGAGPYSELEVENRRGLYLAAEGALQTAEARAEQARIAAQSQIDGVNTTVARLRAEVADAQYDLDQTVVRAPTSGFVTQVALRPGLYVMPNPLRPSMVFVHDADKDRVLGAAFQQNTLQRVHAGDEAEILFEAVPGRVFKGKVNIVLDAIAAGQLQPTGALQDYGARLPGGRALAVIDIVDDISAYQIPAGASGEVAIYTEHFHHISMLRRILLRMRSWQNYIYIEGH